MTIVKLEVPLIAPKDSEEDLALRFAHTHANDLRYVPEAGQWYVWDGKLWLRDTRLFGFNRARKICRDAANENNDSDHRKRALASSKTIAAVATLARSDPRIVATIDQWDTDPWLLNTPDGVVNLKTGALLAHDPDYYMTKITAVGPDKDCSIELWLKFLRQVTDNDKDLQDYLQCVLGYSLTGITNEEQLWHIYGPGGNGKGTLIETIMGIMREYSQAAPIETLTTSDRDRHPTELARLHGARLVTASETEEGRRWAETRIKQLTGGDPVPARFMRQNFFTYKPQFKLIITGNHKPGIRSVNEAIRRRVNLILFDVVIADVDKHLKRKLQKEWPGILSWMIRGCSRWRDHGLNAPEAVTTATTEYLDQEDSVKMWIEERCDCDRKAWTPRGKLFDSWGWYTSKEKKPAGTRPDFYQKLREKGYETTTVRGERGFKGLRLKPL